MNYSKLDFDTIKHDGHWYFLIGSNITSSIGTIEDPVVKFKILSKLIVKIQSYTY